MVYIDSAYFYAYLDDVANYQFHCLRLFTTDGRNDTLHGQNCMLIYHINFK